jgi:hypothetical protein
MCRYLANYPGDLTLPGSFEITETALVNLRYSGKRANILGVGLQILVMKGRSLTEGFNFPELQLRVHHQSVQSFINDTHAISCGRKRILWVLASRSTWTTTSQEGTMVAWIAFGPPLTSIVSDRIPQDLEEKAAAMREFRRLRDAGLPVPADVRARHL